MGECALNLLPVSGLVAHARLDVREFLGGFVWAACVRADVTAGPNQSAASWGTGGGGAVTNGSGRTLEERPESRMLRMGDVVSEVAAGRRRHAR